MQLMPGYKQTEVGVIPEEWTVARIGDIGETVTGSTPPTGDKRNFGDEYLFATPGDLGESTYIMHTARKLSPAGFRASRRLPRGSVLFVSIGSTIGKCGIASEDMAANQQINAVLPNPGFSSEFLHLALSLVAPRIREQAGTQAVPIVNKSQFSDVRLALPSIRTQVKIAEALGDVERSVIAIGLLIAKKRDIKQATMQRLLTGEQRLPGFEGEWELQRLGELGEIAGAGVDKTTQPDEVSVRLVNYLDVYRRSYIHSRDLQHIVTAPPAQTARCAVRRGDVFFTPSSETRDDIARSAVAMEDIADAVYSYHVVRLRLKVDWDVRFRAYAFQTRDFLTQAETACDGSGTRYVISLPKFRSLTVRVPSKPEQAAIATVLSDMDAELAALDQRLAKIRAVKQAMMQELLTGRTRLV